MEKLIQMGRYGNTTFEEGDILKIETRHKEIYIGRFLSFHYPMLTWLFTKTQLDKRRKLEICHYKNNTSDVKVAVFKTQKMSFIDIKSLEVLVPKK